MNSLYQLKEQLQQNAFSYAKQVMGLPYTDVYVTITLPYAEHTVPPVTLWVNMYHDVYVAIRKFELTGPAQGRWLHDYETQTSPHRKRTWEEELSDAKVCKALANALF